MKDDIGLEYQLLKAVGKGDLGEVKDLLLNHKADIHTRNVRPDFALSKACEKSNLELVKYLTSSKDLNDHIECNTKESEALMEACSSNKEAAISVVNYLINGTERGDGCDISAQEDSGIIMACYYRNLHLVKHLLTGKNLKKHSNIHAQGDTCFKILYNAMDSDVEAEKIISFLLFEYKELDGNNYKIDDNFLSKLIPRKEKSLLLIKEMIENRDFKNNFKDVPVKISKARIYNL